MKHLTVVTALVLGAAVAASAQESAPTPVIETGFTYSFTNGYPGGGAPSFLSHGGSGTFVYNVNRWLGAVADLGAYHNNEAVNFNPTTFSYLFGPRVSWRNSSRYTPYVQALFGGARVSADLLNSAGNTVTENGYAQAFGGGLDVRITDHFAVKPFQVEYVMTRLPNIWSAENNQNNLRYSAGVVFRFGSK